MFMAFLYYLSQPLYLQKLFLQFFDFNVADLQRTLRYPRPLKDMQNKCEYIQYESFPYFLSTFLDLSMLKDSLLHIFC